MLNAFYNSLRDALKIIVETNFFQPMIQLIILFKLQINIKRIDVPCNGLDAIFIARKKFKF